MVLLLQVRLVVSETKRYFWYVLCRSYFMMCKVYNVCCHYNDLVQKVTLKCLNNTLLIDTNIVTTLLREQSAARI